jgi:hypothetical protein
MIYPYNAPVIMTDVIFTTYGGQVGSTVVAQRQGAYLIAEMAASADIDTLLIPTRVTGSYYPHPSDLYLLTDYAYVTNVANISMYDYRNNLIYSTAGGIQQGYFNVRNWELGQIDLFYPIYWGIPYRIEYVYDCGLPTGTSNSPDMLLALTTYANIILNEIMGYGNESVGDIGVQDFQNQQYRETRVKLLQTSFGSSAKANFAHKLLTRFRLHRRATQGL